MSSLTELEQGKLTTLDVGTYDVTPDGLKDKRYEVTVIDPGNGDNVGWVKITSQTGSNTTVVHPLNDGSGMAVLPRPLVISEHISQGVKIHRVVLYRRIDQ